MARWHKWVFELQAPEDEFMRLLQRGLAARGAQLDNAEHFAFIARAFGARAFIEVGWAEKGIEVRAKVKSGLFGAPAALEAFLLESGREAQVRLTYSADSLI